MAAEAAFEVMRKLGAERSDMAIQADAVRRFRSLAINQELGSKEGMAKAYGHLGHTYSANGDKPRICECWREMGLAAKAAEPSAGCSATAANRRAGAPLNGAYRLAAPPRSQRAVLKYREVEGYDL
jgi:hypothetical protein